MRKTIIILSASLLLLSPTQAAEKESLSDIVERHLGPAPTLTEQIQRSQDLREQRRTNEALEEANRIERQTYRCQTTGYCPPLRPNYYGR